MISDNIKSVNGLKKCRFSYGPNMQKLQAEINISFLTCIAVNYGQSVKALLLAGEVVVTEVDKELIPRFKREEEEMIHLARSKHQEKKLYYSTIEDYTKFSRTIRKDLVIVCRILHALCNISLQNRIKAELVHITMVKKNRFYTLKLCSLVRKIYNESAVITVED